MSHSRSKRVLLYSHDSFGLGHVSRCRTIANALVEADPNVSVLIVSGSPMIGSYEFRSGIDFVRIPGVVAMGGYNTFCEILSFDKRAIIVPRTRPRLEQFIRARAARNVGLIEMLDADRGRDPHAMATALRQLPQQGLPSDVVVPGLLDGLASVSRLVAKQLAHPHRGPAPLEAIWSDRPTESGVPAAAPPSRASS